MNQFSKRRPLYSRQVPFGHIDSLWRNPRHKSGLNQAGRILQKFVAGHTPEDPIHILSKAALHGDTTALGALHDHLDEIKHPYGQLKWREIMKARSDEKSIFPHAWPGYLFKVDKLLFDYPNARKKLDERLEEKQFHDNRTKANGPEQKRRGTPTRLESYKAPAGGLVARGTFYTGGRMLPKEATQTAPRPQNSSILASIVKRLKKKKAQKTP